MSRRGRFLRNVLGGLVVLTLVGLAYWQGQRASFARARNELKEEKHEISIAAVLASMAKPQPRASDLTFAVMGDTRDGEDIFSAELAQAARRHAQFAIVLGDLVSSGRADHYLRVAELLERAPLPVLVVPGNHDYAHAGKAIYRELFGPGDYTFDLRGYRFIMLDDAEGQLTAGQLQWLKAKLHTRLPKLVFMHIPPGTFPQWSWHSFSSGALAFVRLMDECHPAVVFMSHIHGYDRAVRHDVPYIVTGGGGAPLATEMEKEKAFYHFLLVKAGPKGVTATVVRPPSPPGR